MAVVLRLPVSRVFAAGMLWREEAKKVLVAT
jgi:hypothetical protein